LGTTLKIVAMSSDNNQPVQLAVSLKGLADALDRVREISSQDGFSSRR
jgi:invasion protein IalB